MASNFSAPTSSVDLYKPEATVLAIVNILFSFVGTLGNVLVFIVLSRNRALHTVTNLLITSLAVGDLFACTAAQPMYVAFLLGLTAKPVYGRVRKVFSFVSMMASISSLSAVTMDRYMAIASPMSYQLRSKVKNTVVVLCGVWLLSLGLGIPCGLDETVQRIAVYYTIAQILVIVPIYVRIFVIARRQARTIARLTGHINKECRTKSERENIATKTVGTVLAVFVVCWFPLIIMPMLYRHVGNNRGIRRALKWSQTLALCSSALNPVIYSLKTETFKKELKKIYQAVFCRHSWRERPESL